MSETGQDPAATAASGTEGTPESGAATATADRTASGGASAASGGVDYEAQARTWQSRYDQAQAELAQLRASAASSGGSDASAGNGAAAADPAPEAAPITQADLLATLGRVEQMRALSTDLRTEFPNADPALFQNYLSHQSPEAFLAAVRQSHTARTAEREEWRKEVDKEWMEKLGPLAKQFEAPADGSQPPAPSGVITIDQWLGMSLKDREKAYAENPAAVDKMLNDASKQ